MALPSIHPRFHQQKKREENVRQKLEEATKGEEENRLPTYFAKGAVPGQMRRLST
jgi:hypothetical protein